MLKRKEKIVISAIELLEEEGMNGLTTKNIAKRQQVTEPALYRQFEGKQDIINSIMEEFGSFDERIQETIGQSELWGKASLLFYTERYAELYENYSELSTILLSMDLYFYDNVTRARMTEILTNRKEFLTELISKCRQDLRIAEQVTDEELASIIQGVIVSNILEWRLGGKSYSLKEKLNSVMIHLL